jgi:alpha-N-arabinofuranosidase
VAAPGLGDVPYLDVVATLDPEQKTASIFILNRDLERPQELEITWHDFTPTRVTAFETITGPDLKAVNTFTDPKRVVPQTLEVPKVGSRMSMRLPARSYSVLSLVV